MFSKSRFNVGNGLVDFWNEFRKPNPYRWPTLVVSSLPVLGALYWLMHEVYYAEPARPTIEYITSFAPDRTDAEIAASNEENQLRKDELRAKQEELAERKKQMYRDLGRATGLDVDAMEEQIARDKAREEADQAAKYRAQKPVGSQGE